MTDLNLNICDVRDRPFPYAVFSSVFAPVVSQSVLDWLESEKSWTLAETEFYDQYEFSIADVTPPASAACLTRACNLRQLRSMMEQLFGVELKDAVDVIAHKLVPEQRIGIHNDMLVGGETHRLTIQMNRGLGESDGGYFMLFNSEDARDVHRILKPIHNSALAFAISEHSHHAVSKQYGGTRYTLVYSFHELRD